MNKLVNNLKNGIYCRLKPDNYGGVGVFAIKDIPKGENPFRLSNGECINYKIINIPKKIVKKLNPEVQKMINAFYAFDEETKSYGIPSPGLNSNDISFYMNTSNNPNIKVVESKKCNMLSFKTNKIIKKGEQLFINYDEYD